MAISTSPKGVYGFCLLVIVAFLFSKVDVMTNASQYDPHVYPSTGPFFEGWYARLTDTENDRSLGVLFGRVLPEGRGQSPKSSSGNTTSPPPTYIGLIRSNGSSTPMVIAEAFPNEEDIEVTVNGGKSVTADPALPTPSHFEWVARPYGFFNATPNSTVFNFTVDGITFSGKFGGPVLWDNTGRGPEGWLTELPFLPIHWFVYSVGTPGTYNWSRPSAGLKLSGHAHAHQEKNWGQGFPSGWVWTQAYNQTANASFAGTFGVVSLLYPSVPAHLFGYRNHKRNIHLDFRPDNSVTVRDLKPCEGSANVRIYSALHTLELSMTAPVETFQKCLRGPVESGFEPNLVETFVASIRITIHRMGLFGYSLVEDQTFHGAAFEFGRDYLCPVNPCSAESSNN